MRYEELNCLERILDGRDEPKNLKLPLLELITENFSSGNKVGRGGCGEVYKGILPNGRFVAVKRLFKSHTIDEKMFNQEVKSMLVAKHRNIVRFLGYCSDTQGKAVSMEGDHHMAEERERLLCFEYIQNGNLADHITDELRGLDWCARYQIIKGICEGLHHLHKDKGILHMDLKPDNILMDDYMVPKITDFGLARTDGKTHTMSTQRLASPGYCAPEYLHQGKMSNKSDIYSLGIIIGQVVTGSKEKPDITKVLGRWRHRWSKSSKHVPLWHEQVKKCLELALQCTRKNPIRRPFIWEILEELNEIDNKNGKARGDTESANEELSPCLEHMLGVEPLEIHFPLALDKEISCSVELTNDTDDYIAFMVSTTSLLQFRTQPKKDIIPPRSKCSVIIAVQAQENAPLNYQSDFYVHSTTVDGTLTTKDITDELFDEEEGHVVDEVNLPVVFNALPPLP
ncbi:hypothetical protein QOZ80_9AG0675300 [Eleusine coracana subsp. coracana]|nr:hypothetical protein QOZ80_9AG0675300 [Eleusine coracana subsp. coracana]